MKKISLRESLIKIDKQTDFEHNLTAMYESCSLTEDEKEKLVKYVDAYDIDSMNKMLNNKFTSDITTTEDAAMMESYFEDGDISDDELASILGGDTKYDIPDGIETPEETEARLASTNEAWEPTFSDEWRPEDIELWKSIDWKARNYKPYIDETKKIRGEVKAVGLPGGTRTGEAMFAKEFSANPIFTPKWEPITDPFEGQGTTGWYMYDGVDADDGYMMMTRTETQEVSDMLSEALDDAEPYTREQIEAQLKELTNNFTRPMGEGRCGFKEEAIYSVDILEKYYEEVDMDKNGAWYDITFAKPIINESKSIKESTDYKVKFFQIFEAPKSPKENGKMIGQRETLDDANAFGKERVGEGNYIIKAVCDDGKTRYIDNDTESDDYKKEINEIATAAEELVAEYLNSNESLDEECLSKDFGKEYLEEATDEDKQAVIEFAKDCRELGHPVEDYKEFASILRDEGMTPSESLYQVYLDAYNEVE